MYPSIAGGHWYLSHSVRRQLRVDPSESVSNNLVVRLVGGAITIAVDKEFSNVGLIVAAIVLLNVGAIPLIMCELGMLRIM